MIAKMTAVERYHSRKEVRVIVREKSCRVGGIRRMNQSKMKLGAKAGYGIHYDDCVMNNNKEEEEQEKEESNVKSGRGTCITRWTKGTITVIDHHYHY